MTRYDAMFLKTTWSVQGEGRMRLISLCCALAFATGVPAGLLAQDGAPKATAVATKKKGAKPTGPPARDLFGAAKKPALLKGRTIGLYAKGGLPGATALPIGVAASHGLR